MNRQNKQLEYVPLKKWKSFCAIAKMNKNEQDWIEKYFPGGLTKVSRFAWRYRLAKSFKRIEVEKMGKPTIEGYSSIFRIMLAYSAWEAYNKVALGKELKGADKSEILKRRKSIVSGDISGLLDFLNKELRPDLKKALDSNLPKIDYELLARAIRHTFAHGILAYHVSGTIPTKTKNICNKISEDLLDVMDKDFSLKVHKMEKSLK